MIIQILDENAGILGAWEQGDRLSDEQVESLISAGLIPVEIDGDRLIEFEVDYTDLDPDVFEFKRVEQSIATRYEQFEFMFEEPSDTPLEELFDNADEIMSKGIYQ